MKYRFSFGLLLVLPFCLHAQNMGVKMAEGELPGTTLDVNGSASLREGTALTLANGANNDISLATEYSFFRLTGPTAAFSITGFGNGQNGRILSLINATTQTMTISSATGSAAANQILTSGGGSFTIPANGAAVFQYNTTLSKWILIGTSGYATAATDWALTGNSGTVDGTNFLGTTDNIPLSMRVNNQKAGRIDATGVATWGYQSGNVNTAANATFIGYQAGKATTTGANNTLIGYQSGLVNTTGESNTLVGYVAGTANTTGSTLVGLGTWALTANTTGLSNVGIGSGTLGQTTTGNYNVAVGTQAGSGGTTGSYHLYVGHQAGANTTSGDGNVFLGYNSGQNIATSNNNTLIGYSTSAVSGISNSAAIGNGATVAVSNKIRLGNNAITTVESSGTFSTVSDKRLKTNILDNALGLTFIKALRPVQYELIAQRGQVYDGFIAQDIDSVLQKQGIKNFSGLTRPQVTNPQNTEGGYYTVSYATFVVPLVNAVKELDKENAALKAELNLMKAQMEEMKKSTLELKADLQKETKAIKKTFSLPQN